MDKKLNIINIIILSAVVVMLISLLVIGTVSQSFPFWNEVEESGEQVESHSYPTNQMKNIQVKSHSLTTRIYITDEDEIKVILISSYSENSRSKLEVNQDNATLDVEVKTKIRFGIFFGSESLEIYLPKSYEDNISFASSSGNITSDDVFRVDTADFATSSGTIALSTVGCMDYKIKSSSGSIRIQNLTGNGEITTSSGGIRMQSIEGESHKIKSTSGTIRIENLTGNGEITTSSGGIRMQSIEGGSHTIKSTSGTIRIENLVGNGEITTSSGGIRLQSMEGESHTIKSTSGTINIEGLTGNVNCQSSSGGIKMDRYTGECSMKSTSGSIRIESMTGFGTFKTSSGGMKINALELTGNLTLNSTSGSIRTTFLKEPSASIEAKSNSGRVKAGFDSKGGNNYLQADLGDGKYKVDARTTSGGITFDIE